MLPLQLEALEDRTVLNGSFVGDLVIFGDSLVDVGNLSLATGGALPPNDLYDGGRFANGPMWVETLAEYLGEPAVQPSLAGGLNYAFAGARITGDSIFPYDQVPNVTEQVGLHLTTRLGEVDSSDLFVFLAGPNDFFFSSAQSGTGTPINPAIPATALADSIEALITAKADGATQFVVGNLPPLGETPYFQDLLEAGLVDQNFINAVNSWSVGYNFVLSLQLEQLRQTYDVTIIEVDINQLFEQATQADNPFGFTNWTDAVGPYNVLGHVFDIYPGVDPDTYLFFDSVHPSATAHHVIGLQAAAQVYAELGVNQLKVANTTDAVDPLDGGLSLREMLDLANTMSGRQIITFDLGRGTHEITLGGSQLSITDDVDIRGLGISRLAINGAGSSRIFDVASSVEASISHMTLKNGSADRGGAIQNAGDLTLTFVNLSGNQATSSTGTALGGAIYNGPGAALDVLFSALLNNSAHAETLAAGGAIANDGGTANIYYSLIGNNRATDALLSQGGGIANFNGGLLNVLGSTITRNVARGGDHLAGGIGGDGLGGGIYNGSGSTLNLRNSLVFGNLAQGGEGDTNDKDGAGNGGGVYLAPGGTAHKKNSLILFNQASKKGDNVFGTFQS